MRVTVDKPAAIVLSGGRMLLCRSHGKQQFFLPGGKREPGETDVDCLRREIREELNCGIDGTPEHLETFHAPAYPADGIIKLACWQVQLDAEPAPSSEVAELTWADSTFPGALLTPSTRDHLIPWLVEHGLLR